MLIAVFLKMFTKTPLVHYAIAAFQGWPGTADPISYTAMMENKPKFTPNPQLRLMDQVHEILRYYHYARSAEKNMGEREIESFCPIWLLLKMSLHLPGSRH